MKSPFERLAGPAALLVIVVLFHWKLTLTHQYTWMENPDIANLDLPWLQFQAGEWHQHRFPLWDPNSWFGQPLFGQGQPGSAYPLNWLLFLAPLKNGWLRDSVLNWYYVLVRYLAALAAYALARELGRSRVASVLAGCVYALGGYVAATPAPQMVNGAVWTPLVFLYLIRAERAERPWRNALLSGFFLGVGWLAGHHQMNLYVSIAAVGLWAWFCVREGKLDTRMLKLAAGSLGVAVLASGFQTVPMAEYGRLAVRWSGTQQPLRFNETVPYTVQEQYSLRPLGLLGVFLPGMARGANPFIGVTALALAILGAILNWRERQARWLVSLSLGGIIFALGSNSLLHGILYALAPLMDKARAPGAGIVLFALGVAPLAAFGLDSLSKPQSAAFTRRAVWVLAGAGALIGALSLIFSSTKVDFDDRITISALAALLAAALLAAWRAGAVTLHIGGAVAIGLVLFELANVTDFSLPNRSEPNATPLLDALHRDTDVTDFIRGKGTAARVEYDDTLVPYNIGDWHGIEAVNAYTASVLSSVWDMDAFLPRSRNFFGVAYYIGKTQPQPGWKPAFDGAHGLSVFENPDAYPRVWSVHVASTVPDAGQAIAKMHDALFDSRHVALVIGNIPEGIGACGSGDDDVQMPLHLSNSVQIRASMGCRGIVILTDPVFPGWQAYVDGVSAPVMNVDGGVRGVMVNAGQHIVEMRYRPMSVLLGALMTLSAAGIVILSGMAGAHSHARHSGRLR